MSNQATKKQTAVEFFYEHAGISYYPDRETIEQGRQRGAEALAAAERAGSEAGLSFHWDLDGMDSSEWIADNEDGGKYRDPWPTWQCVCRDMSGAVVASLGGVDFGRGGVPHKDPYRRVVEAELGSEAIGEGE